MDQGFGILNGWNSPSLGFNAVGAHQQTHVLNLGDPLLTHGEGQGGSCTGKLVKHVSDLDQVCLKHLTPHKDVISIDEVATVALLKSDVEPSAFYDGALFCV